MDLSSLISSIIEQLQAFSWVDWTATITALFYIILAARNNDWCWIFSVISSSLWAYASLVFYQLYSDALLQVFYVVMGLVGIYKWQLKSSPEASNKAISSMSIKEHGITFLIGIPTALLFGYFFAEYTTAAATYLDAFTTIFAVITTYWLVQKRLENWLYWIVIDIFYVYLYADRGAYLYAAIMVVYIIIAAIGWINWKKEKQLATR